MKQLIFIFVVVVVLGGLYIIVENRRVDFIHDDVKDVVIDAEGVTEDSGNEGETDFVPTDTTSGMRMGENAVVSLEQRPGKNVKIAQVYLAAPGYVVIYADTDGEATAILGSSALMPAGESSNIVVPVSRATVDGESLWAMLHSETNSNKVFNADIDVKAQDGLGESISGWFTIKANAEENASITL